MELLPLKDVMPLSSSPPSIETEVILNGKKIFKKQDWDFHSLPYPCSAMTFRKTLHP